MVDQGRRPGEERLHAADQRRGTDGRLVEGPVEPPPDPLEDLEEVARRRKVVGHAARERRVEVGVGAHVAGDHDAAASVDPVQARLVGLGCGRHRSHPVHSPALDDDVGHDQPRRGPARSPRSRPRRRRLMVRTPSGPRPLRASRGRSGPRGRRVAHRESRATNPVERVERAGHRGRRRHQDRLAHPLGAVRTLGLRDLDQDGLDGRHRGGRDDAERLERVGDRDAVRRPRTPRSAPCPGPCGRRPRPGPRAAPG